MIIFQGAIVIHEVYEDGAAAEDGRLWAGDQILEVRLRYFIVFLVVQGKKLPLVRPSETSTLLSRTSGFTKALVLRDE